MKDILPRYRALLRDRRYLWSLAASAAMLAASVVVMYFAALYAFDRASSPVSDIVLSNIPVFDVDWAFVWGPIVFWAAIAVFLLWKPERIPFALKSIALFVVVRSAFITLTHIGPYPDHVVIDSVGTGWLQTAFHGDLYFAFFGSGSDLFFSGHTGLPFLMALVFWADRRTRAFCLVAAAFFAAVVLMGHLHYSIDVASAFFITYAIFAIAKKAFKRDLAMGYSQEARP
ncbi:MAG: hypothetical protein KGI69_01535 [Patescibacteria group bacterium]|nr:hypothetical protein [Patescibacteria group bacterium]